MIIATGITLLFVAATSALTAWSRLPLARRSRAALGGVAIGTGMAAWCLFAGLWWLGLRP